MLFLDSKPFSLSVRYLIECESVECDGATNAFLCTLQGGLGYPFLENTEISEVWHQMQMSRFV